jgi:hypothetical protein
MDAMAIALVFLMGVVVSAVMALLMWGLVLEARSNREWRERGLAR